MFVVHGFVVVINKVVDSYICGLKMHMWQNTVQNRNCDINMDLVKR